MLACIAAMLGVCAHLCPITLRCHAVCQLGSLYTLVLLQGGADGGRWAAGVTVLCTAITLFLLHIKQNFTVTCWHVVVSCVPVIPWGYVNGATCTSSPAFKPFGAYLCEFVTLCNRNLSSWTDITDKWVIYLWFACTLGHFQVAETTCIWYNIVYDYTCKFGLYNAVSVKKLLDMWNFRSDPTDKTPTYTINMKFWINILICVRIYRRTRSRGWCPYCRTIHVDRAILW